ncbi:MAG: low affinity potassium transporter [Geoglossum simile]|nr:MAG: low affinity potassium transporter [Geoglossum simile]
MFGPFIHGWAWLKGNIPRNFSVKKLKFISIHCSVILFAIGGLRYIDALFFASGGATQAGLNTVDINKIKTAQQMVLYIMPMIANPIFINTTVVFIRLYWFEKRFQHIVEEARSYRRTRSRARTEAREETNPGCIERGVGGRDIIVLHENRNTIAPYPGSAPTHMPEKEASSSSESSGRGSGNTVPNLPPERPRDIQLENPQASHGGNGNMRGEQSVEQHITFLEKQRNPKDEGTLRIPGPRDFDRGDVPQRVEDGEENTLFRSVTEASQADVAFGGTTEQNGGDTVAKRTITIDESSKAKLRKPLSNVSLPRMPSVGSAIEGLRSRARSSTWNSKSPKEIETVPYLSYSPTIGRNSAFANLTEEQRDELGGIEYRALKTLAAILVSYFVALHTLGWVFYMGWIMKSSKYGSVVTSVGQARPWWAFFTAASMFNDLGFTLTPDSMVSFQGAVFPLLLGSFLIVVGNTGFPIMLRLIIWLLSKFATVNGALWEELNFLLDHPRRCFTLLFPSKATWWLFWVLVLLNGVDLVFFIILDLNDPTVTSIAAGYRVLDGWFQAASTRTAGFSVVNLANLHPAIQVSYLVMMYISVLPIAISVRGTNVYEEKSLGIWASPEEDKADAKDPSYVGAHLRKQLSFDLWYLALGLFIISIAEGKHIQNVNEYVSDRSWKSPSTKSSLTRTKAFTIFSVLFEIVSAYGTVGMSLGYPNTNPSFSAQFSTISKLVVIAMQLRGRHRGLPYELDRAILLPSESLHQKEDEDAQRWLQRRRSLTPITRNSNVSSPQVDGEGGLF